MKFHLTLEDAKKQLQNVNDPFIPLLRHGTLLLEYFSPQKKDTQTPHKQDELYVITSGKSLFYRGDELISCKQGDVLFVPAGMHHHFQNFSDDFATWVIFYGKDGGEASVLFYLVPQNKQTVYKNNNSFSSSTPSVADFSIEVKL